MVAKSTLKVLAYFWLVLVRSCTAIKTQSANVGAVQNAPRFVYLLSGPQEDVVLADPDPVTFFDFDRF
jgi:hypothetical protein